VITKGEMVSKPVYDMAKQFARIAADGILRGAVTAGEAAGNGHKPEGDDVPF